MGLPAPINWMTKIETSSPDAIIWGATILNNYADDRADFGSDPYGGPDPIVGTIVDTSLQKMWQDLGKLINWKLMKAAHQTSSFDWDEVKTYFNEDSKGVSQPFRSVNEDPITSALMEPLYETDPDLRPEIFPLLLAKNWWSVVNSGTDANWKQIERQMLDYKADPEETQWWTYKILFESVGDEEIEPSIWGYDDEQWGEKILWTNANIWDNEAINTLIGNEWGDVGLVNYLYPSLGVKQLLELGPETRKLYPVGAEIYDRWVVKMFGLPSPADLVVILWKQT